MPFEGGQGGCGILREKSAGGGGGGASSGHYVSLGKASAGIDVAVPYLLMFVDLLRAPKIYTWYVDLKDTLDKLMHFLPQPSDFVPLKNAFYSFRSPID